MKNKLILLQESRWVGGWLEYSLYGLVVIAIIIFLVYKIRKGKERKHKNDQIRKEDIEDRG